MRIYLIFAMLGLCGCMQAQITFGGGSILGGALTAQNNPPLSITPSVLPNGVVGVAYSQTVATTGGVAPLTFSVVSGALPPGLSLNTSTGAVTGSPSTTGSYPIVVKVVDSGTQSASQSFTIPVTCTPLSISTTSLPGGTVGSVYTNQVQSSGGTTPITWMLTGGSLPLGLTLSSGGLISGTPTTGQTNSPIIQAQDSCFPTPQSASNSFSLSIVNPVTITTTSPLPPAVEGSTYSTLLAAVGGASPYTWSVSAGALPAGLSLSSVGAITGTPTVAGNGSFSAKVQDSGSNSTIATFSLPVTCSPMSISTTSLPNAVPGTLYSTHLNSSGGNGAVSWSIVSGTLPSGMSLSSSGTISGTTAQNGNFLFTVQAQDSCNPTPQAITSALTLTVISPVTITTSSVLPGVTQGQPYSVQMAASGGTSPYSWTGTPPSGLSLSSAGVISGAPTSSGSTPFSIQVQDVNLLSAVGQFQIPVTCPAISITSSSPLSPATVGQAYSAQLQASGGILPYTWSGTSIPAGMGISVGGLFGGTPTSAGTFTPSISVHDSCAPTPLTTSKVFSITISNPIPTLTITSTSPLPPATELSPYSVQLASTGGAGPNTWSVSSGSLPAGLLISGSGVISGTPTTAGTSSPTIKVADSASHIATAVLSITVSCTPLSITTTSPLANGTQSSAYSQTLAATGGIGAIGWTVTGGALPTGVTLSNIGQVSGTPSVSGTFNVTIAATDHCSPTPQTSSRAFTITISPAVAALSISTTTPLPSGTQGVAYSTNMAATGGVQPYSWTKTAGSLPAGLSIATSGAITGTPTTIGTTSATLQVADSASHTASGVFNASVSCVSLGILTTSPLTTGSIGAAYSQQMQSQGGTGTLTWTLSAGSFPSGISISTGGLISGTTHVSGTFTPTITITDSCSTPQVVTNNYSLVISDVPLTFVTTSPLPNATAGQAYSVTLMASGGTLPYVWSLSSGSFPTGLSLNTSTGTISGTPSGSGTSTFVIGLNDNAGHGVSKTYTISLPATSCGGPFTITAQQPVTCVPYSGNPASVTPQRIPSDVMSHLATGDPVQGKTAIAGNGVQFQTPGSDDGGVPLYYSKPTDPYFKTSGCTTTNFGQTFAFRAPNNAPATDQARPDIQPVHSGDSFHRIWDQSTGLVWGAYPGGWTSATPYSVGSSSATTPGAAATIPTPQYCGMSLDFFTGRDWGNSNGWLNGQGDEGSMNFAPFAGIVRAQELIQGQINHALLLGVACTSPYAGSLHVFPSFSNTAQCTTTNNMPPNGALLFLDYTDGQINALNLPAWQKTLVTALAHYGGYVDITGSTSGTGSLGFSWESGLAYQFQTGGTITAKSNGMSISGGTVYPLVAYLQGQGLVFGGSSGTSTKTNRVAWLPADAVNHIHMAAPCVAQALAGQPGGCP